MVLYERIWGIETMTISKNIEKILSNKIKLKTKKGTILDFKHLSAEEVLKEINEKHNHSWYQELYNRNQKNLEDIALIYRGNEITYGEMFNKMKSYAKAMKKMGLDSSSEIPVCLSNCPEIVYIMGAASMIGASVNIFGSSFPTEYIKEIIDNCNSNIIFMEDNAYSNIAPALENGKIEKAITISLRDSLKNNFDPLEEKDKFENKVDFLQKENAKILKQTEFIDYGKDYQGPVQEKIDLDKDFMITYTSGSTNEKHPKAIVHSSRCYITVARYHNKDLNGGFVLKPYTFLSLIPTYSNSNILSIISDCLVQGAKLAFEPIYTPAAFLDSLIEHNPHYVAATKSFWLYAAKKILQDPEYKDVQLKNLFLAFSCGESFEINEEKLINQALKKGKAGLNVTHTPFSVVKMS